MNLNKMSENFPVSNHVKNTTEENVSVMNKFEKYEDQKNNSDTKSSIVMSNTNFMSVPNVFHFWNGDEYVGDILMVKDRIAMNEKGVYKTSDGHVYEGIWDNDYLKQANKITFPDKTVFTGTLNEMTIQGRGKYIFTENFELEGEFVDNDLVGMVHLTDRNKQLWKGYVEDGWVVNFNPVHSFWQTVLNLPPKVQVFDTYPYAGEAEESFGDNEEF